MVLRMWPCQTIGFMSSRAFAIGEAQTVRVDNVECVYARAVAFVAEIEVEQRTSLSYRPILRLNA